MLKAMKALLSAPLPAFDMKAMRKAMKDHIHKCGLCKLLGHSFRHR